MNYKSMRDALVGALLMLLVIFLVPGFFTVMAVKAMILIILMLLVALSFKTGQGVLGWFLVAIAILMVLWFYVPGVQVKLPLPALPNEF